jgi:hypothetical protein
VTSGQALAGVVGPLIEVPVLVGLVYVSLALRKRFTPVRLRPQRRPLPDGRGPGQAPVRRKGPRPFRRFAARRRRFHPLTIQALAERGIEITEAFPKPLTDDVVHAADVIITMGCGDACPIFPGKRYEDWDVADPSGQPIEVVRAIRDDIQARVTTLLGQVLHHS